MPIIPFIEGDGIGIDVTPVMLKVVDAAVRKAYGGKRRIAWMEIYSGEKANSKIRPGGFRMRRCRLCAISWCRSRGRSARRSAAASARPTWRMRQSLDLYACVRPIRYFPGVLEPDAGCRAHRHGGVPREHRGHLRRHRVARRLGRSAEAHRATCSRSSKVTGIRFPASSGIGIKPVSKEGSQRLDPQGDPVRRSTTIASR